MCFDILFFVAEAFGHGVCVDAMIPGRHCRPFGIRIAERSKIVSQLAVVNNGSFDGSERERHLWREGGENLKMQNSNCRQFQLGSGRSGGPLIKEPASCPGFSRCNDEDDSVGRDSWSSESRGKEGGIPPCSQGRCYSWMIVIRWSWREPSGTIEGKRIPVPSWFHRGAGSDRRSPLT